MVKYNSAFIQLSIFHIFNAFFFFAEVRTTQQGQVYFYHLKTGVSTWHDPRIPRDFSPTVSPDSLGPLPPGWEMRQTSSGRVQHRHPLLKKYSVY